MRVELRINLHSKKKRNINENKIEFTILKVFHRSNILNNGGRFCNKENDFASMHYKPADNSGFHCTGLVITYFHTH